MVSDEISSRSIVLYHPPFALRICGFIYKLGDHRSMGLKDLLSSTSALTRREPLGGTRPLVVVLKAGLKR